MADRAQRPSRFATPSSGLDLNAVASRQLRKIRLISLAVAIVLHGSLAIWKVSAERRAVKPLTTRFIKREPRLVKPLELRKAPKPKRRRMRRRMKRVRARVDTRGLSRAPKASEVLGSIVVPATEVGTSATFQRPELEPLIVSGVIEAVKGTRGRLDMRLEMMDLQTLDYGRHQAAVVQDPEDKRRITGFFKLALLTSEEHRFSNWGTMALWNLAEAINEFTDVRVEVIPYVWVASKELLESPWAALPVERAPLTKQEARNLGEYLTRGGFLVTDRGGAAAYFTERKIFEDAFATKGLREGRHWAFVTLDDDHPLFSAFYDLGGAPVTLSLQEPDLGGGRRDKELLTSGLNTEKLRESLKIQGVEYAGRLIGVLEAGIWRWLRHDGEVHGVGSAGAYDNRNDLYYGVNLVIFSLTQEGSLAARFVKAGG